jgi:hypothetical protein
VREEKLRILIFVHTFLTILISGFVFLVFGFLGLCAMSACLGSGSPSIEDKLLGAAVVMAASAPLIASLAILIAHWRGKRLGSLAKTLIWAVIAIAAALGFYQVLTDPGDAFWAGLPLMTLSTLLALSMWSFPKLH